MMTRTRSGLIAGVIALCVLGASPAARADAVVGLFAPTAPFPSTGARVELASRLGEAVSKALGQPASGKVFARGSDFQAAVKKGEVTIALVDATYLAVGGGIYSVIAAGVRSGDTTSSWQIVAHPGDKVSGLKGKRVLVPIVGGREADFVTNVLLGGEVGKDFFAKIDAAPDTASALAQLGLGKVDAVVVPAGVELPAGTATILTLPALAGQVLVAYGNITPHERASLATMANTFKGDTTVASFRVGDTEPIHQITRRYSVAIKRGPLAIPAIRVLVGDLVEGRTMTIERTPVTAFAVGPEHH